jgi:AcrR family transcriptional regulator
LNVSSAASPPPPDDRTTKARIRDAAIECIAAEGVADTTARRVAEVADVSPGLVIHHYGTMEGLRSACDEHVAARIRHIKEEAMAQGPGVDILGALRTTEAGPLIAYLAEVITENSPTVAKLVDELVDDAERYMKVGVEAGLLQPTDDLRGRAVVMTMWNLGALVLHRHLYRLTGVDLTDPDFGKDASFAAYGMPVYEIYGSGVLTEPFAANARRAMAQLADASNASRSTDPETPEERP